MIGVEDALWGEKGVAFVVLRGASGSGTEPPPSADDLATHLASRLARFKVPREWRFVDALPRTAYGKVVKAELVELWGTEREAGSAPEKAG